MDKSLLDFLSGERRAKAVLGGREVELRVLPARQLLEARREGAEIAQSEQETALCVNAALLARAVFFDGERVFRDAGELLDSLTAEKISGLTAEFAALCGREAPAIASAPEKIEELKKASDTPRQSASSGVS